MLDNNNNNVENNSSIFRECVSGALIQRSLAERLKKPSHRKRASKARKHASGREPEKLEDEVDETADLAEFADYIATEIFSSFPQDLQNLSYPTTQKDSEIASKYIEPLPEATLDDLLSILPLSVSDSLQTYAIIPDPSFLPNFLAPIFTEYISATTAAPPQWSSTRTSACEICERGWIPLTYHHLIPKETHAKVLKRGWHEEWKLNSVAWLCGACHRFVHGCATNEELAREWWSVERLMMREDVQAWARWRGSIRWKKR